MRREIELLNAGKKELVGFQSESDDVEVKLTFKKAYIEYDYWDAGLGDFVQGKGDLDFDLALKQIEYVIDEALSAGLKKK